MKILLAFLLVIACLAQEQKYSETVGGKMAHLSTAIYGITKADQRDNLCPDCYPGFTLYRQVLGNKILAIVGHDDQLKSVVVVFRGSDNLANWLTDANIFKSDYSEDPKNCKKCKVHKGFYNSHKRLVKQNLNEVVKEALNQHPNYGIIFTGHSLGGAVANLAATNAKQLYPERNIQLYTFGQPRVGNQNYANYVDRQVPAYFRVVNQKDVVPHKPSFISFFRHSGTEYWYKNGMTGDFIACKGESNDCSNGVGSSTFRYSAGDHSSKNYVQLQKKTNPNASFQINLNEAEEEAIAASESGAVISQNDRVEQSDLFSGQESDDDL